MTALAPPWRSADARRTYAAGALWIAGSVAAFLVDEPHVAGWLRVRLDAPGLVLLAAAAVGGWNFFPKGLRAARTLRLDMNFLMTVAIVGAVLIGEPTEAAAIASLFSLAELLERAAVARARRSIEELVHLSPELATLVAPDGTESLVPSATLKHGNRVRVRPGQKIPIDGVVVDGASSVDEAAVTGESVPVPKQPGNTVFAATVNAEGYLEIEATTDAGQTTLDRIVRLVRTAEARRARVERFVDRFARVYTPAVTVTAALVMIVPPTLGLGTGLDWFTRGLTLLVVACPCALVIATPVTVVSAITSASRHGVLIKGGAHLESLGRACAMAFDKTGSLTWGKFRVTDVTAFDPETPEQVLRLAAAAEQRSEHPIARAIAATIPASRLPSVTHFHALPGRGVIAEIEGNEVRVGTPTLMPNAVGLEEASQLEREGKTVVLVAVAGTVAGIIAVEDTVRSEAPEVLRRLRQLGIHEFVMLTGDHERLARTVAERVGIARVQAGLLPEAKVDAVRDLAARHRRGVMMLGDGVNDAPALAAATVGIAMGAAGSPAAIETADVALMADDLEMLPYAVRVGRLARRLIQLNIALALGLKLVLAVGAVAGVVTLMIAVLFGDLGASLAVTLNAMRLARVQPEP